MSWFEVLSIGMDVLTYSQISKTRKYVQSMESDRQTQMIQAEMLQTLKNLVFATSQGADKVQKYLPDSPQTAYVGGYLLDWRIKNIGITADVFPEFSDKEYFANTQKKISKIRNESIESMSANDRADAEECVTAILEMQDLNKAIKTETQNEEKRKLLQKANQIQQELQATDEEWKPLEKKKNRNRLLGIFVGVGGPMLICLSSICVSSVMDSGRDLAGNSQFLAWLNSTIETGFTIVMILLTIVLIIGGVILFFLSPSKEYAEMSRKRSQIRQRIPRVQSFREIEGPFAGYSLKQLTDLRDQRQMLIIRILGDVDDDYDLVFMQEQLT